MNQKDNDQQEVAKIAHQIAEPKPFLKWNYKYNEDEGQYEFDCISYQLDQ